MKDMVNKFISNLHVFVLLYGLYGAYILYDEHSIRMEHMNAQFAPVEAEIINNQKKVKEIQEFVKKTEESKVRVEEVAKNIESAQKQLPAEINDGQILTFINQEISSLNIKDPQITPGAEVVSTYFISKEYKLKVKGTFLQLLIFLERVGNATRIYNIKDLRLVNTDTMQRGRFQLITGEGTIEAFRYNPDFKVDRGIAPTEPPLP